MGDGEAGLRRVSAPARMKALSIRAGPVAMQVLRSRGLRPQDVRIIPAAAGGPKGLILNSLDRFIFGDWLAQSSHTVHLLGASIGAWRMATACLPNADAGFAQLARDYIAQDYPHAPGRLATKATVSELFCEQLKLSFGGREAQVLAHPRYRLHVFTSRGRHLLRREGRLRTPLGYLGAVATNALNRNAMGAWLERVVFSDARETLPLHLRGYRTRRVPLEARNLLTSLLASCSIPFALNAVHDIFGAPRGAYWDGGITDYHLHLDYASLNEALMNEAPALVEPGLVLYPHFQQTVVPGWFDKALKRRHRATPDLDNVILLSPNPQWVNSLPNGKLPDRGDFKRYVDAPTQRAAAWSRALIESERMRDDFANWLERGSAESVQPLF